MTRVVFHIATPPGPKAQLQRLPPMLRTTCQAPISGYSKGSRGLSVLVRERGIFTTTTISPSPSLRQCRSRYTIRAGRKLPDKEFRYLRTVIVTAALHWRFGFQLRYLTGRLNVPAAGRRQSLYGVDLTSQGPVFLVNSRSYRFSVTCSRRRPFSRTYGAILPSSLTRVLSSALVYSTRQPVSV